METIEAYRIEAKYYDLFYGDRTREAHFYADLASGYGKKVLELGVGTTALAIPLAAQGYEVTGIDNSPDMLAVADTLAANKAMRKSAEKAGFHLEGIRKRDVRMRGRF